MSHINGIPDRANEKKKSGLDNHANSFDII